MTPHALWVSTALLVGLWSQPAFAVTVSAEQARQVAEQVLLRHGSAHQLAVPAPTVESGLFRVFGLEPQGYLVVAADTELPPVPAYSWNADVGQPELEPNPLLALLEADLASRLAAREWLTAPQRAERHQQWESLLSGLPERDGERREYFPPEGSTATGGWVETRWGQGPPWNDDCPTTAAGVRGLAGCPAVTMGQILAYHRTLGNTRFAAGDRYHHNYAGNSFWIDDDWASRGFPAFPELNSRLDSLEAHWATEQDPDAADQAALIFACGTAARQVYSPQGSGTFNVGQAFSAWQRFGCDAARLLDDDDEEVYAQLEQNMRDGLPAHLAVVTPAWDAGHNLVVDGWNSNGYFHLNFGWEGAYDGWYLLPQELPFNLSVLEGLVVDIQPAQTALTPPERPDAGLELRGWPNPCNPRLQLECRLEHAARARVELFDLGGRRVALLHDGPLPAGTSQLTWHPTGASGLYLARLSLPERGAAVSTRVLLLR